MRLREGRGIRQEADQDARDFAGFTGFGENFSAAVTQFINEEQTTSKAYDPQKEFKNPFTEPLEWLGELGQSYNSRRIKVMQQMIEDGDISEFEKNNFTEQRPRTGSRTRWNDMAEYINLRDGVHVVNTDQDRIDFLDFQRGLSQDIFNRQDTSGFWGSLAGGFVAGGLDPVAVVSMPLAAPLVGSVRTSRAAYVASTFGRTAAFEMAVQGVAIEPFIHDWKEEIGAEYTWKDSVINLAASGILSGTINATGAGLGFKLTGNKFLDKDFDSLYAKFRQLGIGDEDAESLALYQHEMNNAPDPEMNAGEFVENLETHQDRMREEGAENFDSEPLLDASEVAEGGTVTFENTEFREATPEVEALAKKMTKAQMIKELNDAGADLDTNPKKHTVDSLRAELDKVEGTQEIRQGEMEADEVANRQAKIDRGRTLVDDMFDELPDDAQIYINNQKVPLKQITNEIDSDIEEIQTIMKCILDG